MDQRAVPGAELRELVRGRAGLVFGLADGRAESPPESRLRVRLVLAGLPPPVSQHPVRLPNGAVAHPDLAWPAGPGPGVTGPHERVALRGSRGGPLPPGERC